MDPQEHDEQMLLGIFYSSVPSFTTQWSNA